MTGFPNSTMTEPTKCTMPIMPKIPAIPIKRDHNCPAYWWLNESMVRWTASTPIPTNAFDSLRNVWLMLGPDYEHSVDQSHIPQDIKVCVHLSRAMKGPTGCLFYLWNKGASFQDVRPRTQAEGGECTVDFSNPAFSKDKVCAGYSLNPPTDGIYILPVRLGSDGPIYYESRPIVAEINALRKLPLSLSSSPIAQEDEQPREPAFFAPCCFRPSSATQPREQSPSDILNGSACLPPALVNPQPETRSRHQPRVTSEDMMDWLAESSINAENQATPAMTDAEIEIRAREFGDQLLQEAAEAKIKGTLINLTCFLDTKTSNKNDAEKITNSLKKDFKGMDIYCYMHGNECYWISAGIDRKLVHQ